MLKLPVISMRRTLTALAAMTAWVLVSAAAGQKQELRIGGAAPAIDVESWLAGEAITPGDGGVYVVEFWETLTTAVGSEAGQRSVGRLNGFLTKYGGDGLAVAVVSGDTPDRVREFVSQAKVQGIRIAADRRNSTRRAWVDRTKAAKLPLAFIVGKGKVMYIGRSTDDGFDATLAKVVGRRYDPSLQEQAEPDLAAARRARKVKNWQLATKHYDKVIALDSAVFAEVALERFDMMLVDMGQREEAYAWARQALLAEIFRSDPGALRMLAVKIMTDPNIPADLRDLDLALAAARQSLEIEGPDDPEALSAVARAHYHRGELSEAIAIQTNAYFKARPDEKVAHKRLLDSYKDAASRAGAASSKR